MTTLSKTRGTRPRLAALEREIELRGGRTATAQLVQRFTFEPREKLLGRFLYACDGDVSEAAEVLVHDLRWREQVHMDNLMTLSPGEILGCDPALVLKRFPCKEFGTDRTGRPVLYYNARGMNADAVLEATSSKAFILYQVWLRESAVRRASVAQSGGAPYYTAVMDLGGSRLAQANGNFYGLIRLLAEVDQKHFPGLFGQMIIINAPIFFTVVWKVVRKFLSPQTERKITIVPENTRQVYASLSALIEREQIPSDFGGDGDELEWMELPSHALDVFRQESCPASPNHSQGHEVDLEEEEQINKGDDDDDDDNSQNNKLNKIVVAVHLPGEGKEGETKSRIDESESVDEEAKSASGPAAPTGPQDLKNDIFLDPGSCLPPHIASLVYDCSEPARAGLKDELLRTIERVLADKEEFERVALEERARLRRELRDFVRLSHDSVNIRMVKAGLRERVQSLQLQLESARQDCEGHARAVKFARNFLEQEASRREEERAHLASTVAHLRSEVLALHEKTASTLPPHSMKRTQQLVQDRLGELSV
ncbi:Phosphatidylinositol/phosphatidylcholine transfer protein SFH1 [Hondaea fermentalgiana]|uniref:Phosphatidylinositol/phosphatidylcholine transfer protein SFH1 n=1 Tax=Hondaea fermentalgiana TaxID=2315210 RepID=A0A2R5GSY6_9STRA|nr:Phosphatidylinositol/phosphatidylcholine transfer protein SFH1 [Hondaea fermentalgiana]|eukprot:GBG33987.1 Phosphatidylinositol/phosphatidylcholine transfer protein SFH1 [Hondaea fermentalgiana]